MGAHVHKLDILLYIKWLYSLRANESSDEAVSMLSHRHFVTNMTLHTCFVSFSICYAKYIFSRISEPLFHCSIVLIKKLCYCLNTSIRPLARNAFCHSSCQSQPLLTIFYPITTSVIQVIHIINTDICSSFYYQLCQWQSLIWSQSIYWPTGILYYRSHVSCQL